MQIALQYLRKALIYLQFSILDTLLFVLKIERKIKFSPLLKKITRSLCKSFQRFSSGFLSSLKAGNCLLIFHKQHNFPQF